MHELDVKIGGNEIDRLRRWYRQGKLRHRAHRFPRTPTPRQVARLLRHGVLSNARFATAVVVRGVKRGEPVELRWFYAVPSLHQLHLAGLLTTPIAYATAQAAAAFIKRFPRDHYGVHPPEDLPAETRRAVLNDLKQRGFSITCDIKKLKQPEDEEEP